MPEPIFRLSENQIVPIQFIEVNDELINVDHIVRVLGLSRPSGIERYTKLVIHLSDGSTRQVDDPPTERRIWQLLGPPAESHG